MTLSLVQRNPAPGAVNVSPSIKPRFTITTDDVGSPVDPATVFIDVNGQFLVSAGVAAPGTTFETNNLGGYDVVLSPPQLFPEEDTARVRVQANDVPAASPLDESWQFMVADARGPVISSAVPAPYSTVTASPATIDITIADRGAGHVPVDVVEDFQDANMNLEHQVVMPVGGLAPPANQVQFTPSVNGKNFESRLGRVIDVLTGVDAGERRRIVSVQGPGLATYDGAQLSGTSETVSVKYDRGLDVWVDGVHVVQAGELTPEAATASWTATVTVNATDIDISIGVPVAWARGTDVRVRVRVSDDNPDLVNVSDIDYTFRVQQTAGPVVTNITPAPGSRDLAVGATPASDLQFDITSDDGVDSATLDVIVDGVAAITNGVAAGDYSTSTISAITDGFQVVLKKNTPYADGRVVHVDVYAEDTVPQAGERRVYSVQFGTSTGEDTMTSGGGEIPGDDVVRVVAFDMRDTSFGDPVRLGHTGYAWDGYLYANGSRSQDQASWFTELGEFPLSGFFVVTATNGWAIVKSLDAAPWMTCAPIVGSGWSMAGNAADSLSDGDFGPDASAFVSSTAVFHVDFVLDKVTRYDELGRVDGTGDITARDSDQASAAFPDAVWALPVGPYPYVSGRVWQTRELGRSLAFVTTQTGNLAVAHDLSPAYIELVEGLRGSTFPVSRVTQRAFPGTWQRVVMGNVDYPAKLLPMALVYNDSGQGTVELWDWTRFIYSQNVTLFLDDASSPALPATEARDADVVVAPESDGALSTALAVATVAQVDIVDVDAPSTSPHTDVDLGLSGIAGAEVRAVALEPGFLPDLGHFYACAAAPADGRVVRFREHAASAPARTVTLSNGVPYTSLSAVGRTRHLVESYVRTSMKLNHESETYVNTSMDLTT